MAAALLMIATQSMEELLNYDWILLLLLRRDRA